MWVSEWVSERMNYWVSELTFTIKANHLLIVREIIAWYFAQLVMISKLRIWGQFFVLCFLLLLFFSLVSGKMHHTWWTEGRHKKHCCQLLQYSSLLCVQLRIQTSWISNTNMPGRRNMERRTSSLYRYEKSGITMLFFFFFLNYSPPSILKIIVSV